MSAAVAGEITLLICGFAIVHPGDGAGGFGPAILTTFPANQQIQPAVVADFDGDGHEGLLFINSCYWPGHAPEGKPAPTMAPIWEVSEIWDMG